jgi:vancomycin aglycone glucosyltransferase
MKISIVTYGTRGDIQPLIALALGLKKEGHDVLLCTPPEYLEMVESYGCICHAVGSNFKDNLNNLIKKFNAKAFKGFVKFLGQETINQIDQLPEIIKGSDLVLASGIIFGVPTAAEYLNIPYRFVSFWPGYFGANMRYSVLFSLIWWVKKRSANFSYRKLINKKRVELGLKPIKDVLSNYLGDHVIAATDAALMVVPKGMKINVIQTGYMHLKHKSESLSDELETFLTSGAPPVYIGFGSMPIRDPQKTSRILIDAAKSINQRLIISSGYAGLKEAADPKDCIFVDDVNFELLFPRVSTVIHHGSAGTMSTAARAGVPQIIIPQMAEDQPYWRNLIVYLGLGPNAGSFRKLSVKGLSKAILESVSNEKYKQKAIEISNIIKNTNGVELSVKAINEELTQIKNTHHF